MNCDPDSIDKLYGQELVWDCIPTHDNGPSGCSQRSGPAENDRVVVPYEGRDRFSESERYRDKDIQEWRIVVGNGTRSCCDDELVEHSPSLAGNERNATHCYWLRLHSTRSTHALVTPILCLNCLCAIWKTK
jgi:hypothetical protein